MACRDKLAALQTQYDALKVSYDAEVAKNASLTSLNASLTDDNQVLVASNTSLATRVNTLQGEVAALTQELADCQASQPPSPPTPTKTVRFGCTAKTFAAFEMALGADLTDTRQYDAGTLTWGAVSPTVAVRVLNTTEPSTGAPTAEAIAKVRAFIATLPNRPVFTYRAEPEDNFGGAANGAKPNFAVFIANHRAWYDGLHDVADIAWNLMAQTFRYPAVWGSATDWWPGEAYVDEVAVDGYAKPNALPYPTPEFLFGPCRDFAAAHGKPWSVYETGLRVSNPVTGAKVGTSADRVAWFKAFGTWLSNEANRPKRYLYWESTDLDQGNNFEIRGEPDTMAALQTLVTTYGSPSA